MVILDVCTRIFVGLVAFVGILIIIFWMMPDIRREWIRTWGKSKCRKRKKPRAQRAILPQEIYTYNRRRQLVSLGIVRR
jgi:hypothetical protein